MSEGKVIKWCEQHYSAVPPDTYDEYTCNYGALYIAFFHKRAGKCHLVEAQLVERDPN